MTDEQNRYKNFKLLNLIVWFVLFFIAMTVFRRVLPGVVESLDATSAPWEEISFYVVAAGWLWHYGKKSRITFREMVNPSAYKPAQLTDLHLIVPLFLISISSVILIQYAFPEYLQGAPEDPVLNSWLSVGGNFLVLVVLAPILEELIFRKALLHNWAKRWSLTKAVVWTSVLFGILHFDIVGGIFFGLVLAFLAIRNRNQVPNIVMHALNNLIAFTLMMTASGQSEEAAINNDTLIVLAVVMSIAVGWVLLGLYLRKPKSWLIEDPVLPQS